MDEPRKHPAPTAQPTRGGAHRRFRAGALTAIHHRDCVHRSVSFRPTHQTRARREELMRISCSRTPSGSHVRAPVSIDFGARVSVPFHSRVTTASAACRTRVSRKQEKTLIRTNAPLVQVRLRGASVPCAEGVDRPSVKKARIFPYLFAPSPRTLEGRSGNGSRSQPAAGPAARRAVSYP